MEERKATERLKQRFEQAGFRIAEGVDFKEHGLRFDLDGFDAAAKVGYEYVTDEAGDGWDVDDAVVATLTDLRKSGALSILVIDEDAAPDEASLDRLADEFLADLVARGVGFHDGRLMARRQPVHGGRRRQQRSPLGEHVRERQLGCGLRR